MGYLSYNYFAAFSYAIAGVIEPLETGINSLTHRTVVTETEQWFLLLRGIFASVGAIAFLIYALQWLRNLYLDDVRVQRELERYSYDINRASWAIETIMEMNSKEGKQLPLAWVEGVCRNLFGAVTNHEKDRSNLESFGSAILRSSAKAKIGTDGLEFELNRKGAKALAKALDNEE